MKNVKKLLVVLPLVLVFVISSLPVFAWIGADTDVTLKLTSDGIEETLKLKGKDFPESDLKVNGLLNNQALLDLVKSKSKAFKEGFELKVATGLTTLASALEENSNATATIEFQKAAESEAVNTRHSILAFNILANKVVLTEIHEIENKSNVKSVRDMAEEFYKYESMRSGTLANYYMIGFEPVPGDGYQNYNFVKEKYNVEIICLVAPKMVPLDVLHVFPDRSDLYETIMVDYYALYGDDCQINNWNAAEIAKTRIQKVNEMGYVFDRAEFKRAKTVESYILDAVDAWGQKVPAGILQANGNMLLIYYKNAPAPVAAPATDPNKRVDAVSAQKTDANVTANLQPNANVQAPVTADAQLPATGAADNAFLFLSSAALMALGTFFFKKH